MASLVTGLLQGTDQIRRSVWVVVDPVDVVTSQRVLAPLKVRLKDSTAGPIAGRSGVYCFTDLRLPAAKYTVEVTPLREAGGAYFAAQKEFTLAPIPDTGAPLTRNFVTVDLLPRPAYPFAANATLARGRLATASTGAGIAGAQIHLL